MHIASGRVILRPLITFTEVMALTDPELVSDSFFDDIDGPSEQGYSLRPIKTGGRVGSNRTTRFI